ncbi:CIA30 family protein [Ruegeria arenilitoris]|uniref:CIA30 family protein n=1 Tax=Ruegeria arenilitoris TaxID=1173585 RepID=UPI0014810697|nr:CIA30 family protein [Ruegeria arenilitoris]
MRGNFVGLLSGLFIIGSSMAQADGNLTEDFSESPETRWDYVADTVMGGVSSGQVQFSSEGDVSFARLTGTVSTENNGGFIQFRRKLSDRPDAGVSGVRLLVRGNGEQYFVHLRTRGTVLPWQYYQAGFATSEEWTEVILPLSDFKASGAMLRAIPVADEITSVGVVAYGRDHEVLVDVSGIGFY